MSIIKQLITIEIIAMLSVGLAHLLSIYEKIPFSLDCYWIMFVFVAVVTLFVRFIVIPIFQLINLL